MKNNRIAVFFVLAAFMLSLSACAGVPLQEKSRGKDEPQKSAKQLKFEREEGTRSLLVKGICSFTGLVIGGLAGLLTSPRQNAVTASIIGCVAGGAVGFGLGMIIFDSTKPGEVKADDNKVKEYFQDYRNIQLKE